jgi:hypothetical protein
MKLAFGRAAVAIGLTLSLAGGASGQERPTAEQVARMRAMSAAGAEHEVLAKMAGRWDQETRYWSQPGGEPVVTRGTAENRMILGGRFLESRSQSDLMGMAFESLTLLGYDRRHGRYTLQQLDNSGTYYVTAAGHRAADTGVITLAGVDEDPLAGHTQRYEFRYRMESEDRWVVELFFFDAMHTRGQGPFKLLEITSTRRRS